MFSCITYQLCVRPMLATAERGVAFSLRTLRLPKIPEVVASATALQIVRKSIASKTLTMELLHSPVPASHVLEWQLQRLLRIVLSLPGKPPNGPHAFRNICKPRSKICRVRALSIVPYCYPFCISKDSWAVAEWHGWTRS